MSGKIGSITTDIIRNGLVFNMDAANRASTIPSTSTDIGFNTINTSLSGSFVNDTFYDSSTITPSLSFGGTDDYIQFTENTGLNFSGDTTISLWVKWTNNASSFIFPIAKQGASAARQYAFYLRNQSSNKTMTLTSTDGGGGYIQSNSTLTVALNTWALMTVSIKSGQVTRKGATNYTLKLLDPSGKPKKRNDKAPLTGKDKRGTRSRLNPFIDYGEKKKPKKKENGIVKPVYKGPTIIKKKKSKA